MRLIAALALLFTASHALAGEEGSHWLKLVQSLEAKGVQSIGSFNLQDFKSKAYTVPFVTGSDAPPAVMAGSRGSAYYTTANPPKIHIMKNGQSSDPSSLPQLELHELLGALKIGDADTSKSTALVALDQADSAAERAKLIQVFGESVFKPNRTTLLVDGGFSVGGGGDLTVIRAKSDVYKFVRSNANSIVEFSNSEFVRKFPFINFEPLKKGDKVVLNYQFRRNPSIDLLSVYLPLSVWKKGEASRAILVKQIATKIESIFPSKKAEFMKLIPSMCQNGESIIFPRPSDDEVAKIQNERGRFILGCKVQDAESGGTSTVGIPNGYSSPDRPGIFNFECTVTASGLNNFNLEFSSTMGAQVTSAKGGTLFNQSDYASFTFMADRDGKILALGLAYYDGPSGKPVQVLKAQSKVSLVTSKGAIGFSCKARP